MAVGCHVATIKLVWVNKVGTVVDKSAASTKLQDVLDCATELRIVPDPNIATTSGWPRVSDYIKLEADNDYILGHLDQTYVITYAVADINGA